MNGSFFFLFFYKERTSSETESDPSPDVILLLLESCFWDLAGLSSIFLGEFGSIHRRRDLGESM